MRSRYLLTMLAFLGGIHGSAALATPALVAATPTANATASRTETIRLTFSEPLSASMSNATLVMTGMPGMSDHPDMKMSGITTTLSKDGKSILLTSARALPAGSYRVDWTVAGADAHHISGDHVFSIR